MVSSSKLFPILRDSCFKLIEGLILEIKALVKDAINLTLPDMTVYLTDAHVELTKECYKSLINLLSYVIEVDHTSQQLAIIHVPLYEFQLEVLPGANGRWW